MVNLCSQIRATNPRALQIFNWKEPVCSQRDGFGRSRCLRLNFSNSGCSVFLIKSGLRPQTARNSLRRSPRALFPRNHQCCSQKALPSRPCMSRRLEYKHRTTVGERLWFSKRWFESYRALNPECLSNQSSRSIHLFLGDNAKQGRMLFVKSLRVNVWN
jgi:hypothetical protein